MSSFVLRIIAIICMIIDHSAFLKYGMGISWMRCIGRIAFPIFAFLLAEGYSHTKNIKKYYIRLLIFALISQIPYYLFNKPYLSGLHLNIGFTLLLGLLSINVYDIAYKKCKKKELDYKIVAYSLTSMVILMLSFIASYFNCDYGLFGVLLIVSFYVFRKNKIILNLGIILVILFKYFGLDTSFTIDSFYYLIFTLSSLIFINLYNGKVGRKMKWLFYLVYPVHLLILSIIDLYI